MAKYDFENLLDDIVGVLQSKFNAKLTTIDSEKGDGIVLKQISSNNAYFLQGLNEEVANFDPFIVYGIEDLEPIENQHRVAERIIMSFIIAVGENGVDNIDRRMFRYSRALKDTIEENWQLKNNNVKLTISRLTPVSFKLLDGDEPFKAIGINIEATLG